MKQVIITAGGTSERIDNVRKITNSSSGKLGVAIANHLLEKDEEVFIYYVCSKSSLRPSDPRVQIIEVEGTIDLKNKIEGLLTTNQIDVFIHSMAVSDYTTDYVTTVDRIKESVRKNPNLDDAFKNIEVISGNKISSYEDNLVIVLKPTPKIISLIKTLSPTTYLVGFKLLDGVSKEELIKVASKLRDKNKCDLVVANDLSSIRDGNHTALIIDKEGTILTAHGKDDIAKKLVRRISDDKKGLSSWWNMGLGWW
jgi:phosphopantothenate-cysteine ligase